MASSKAVPAYQEPPAYNDISDGLAMPRDELKTLSGKLAITQTLVITNTNPLRVHNRRIVLRDASTDAQEYLVTFQADAPSWDIKSMELHRGKDDGAPDAKITFPAIDHVIASILTHGDKTRVVEKKDTAAAAQASSSAKTEKHTTKSTFAVGDLIWRTSDQYLHPEKGKSRAGDIELVNTEGEVFAVFLNGWSGNPSAKDVGKICFTEKVYRSSEGSPLAALAISSMIVVATHISWRNRDGAKEFFKEMMHGGLLMCNVM